MRVPMIVITHVHMHTHTKLSDASVDESKWQRISHIWTACTALHVAIIPSDTM